MGSFLLEDWSGEGRVNVVATVVGQDNEGSLRLRSIVQGVSFGATFIGDMPGQGDETTLLGFALTRDGKAF